MHSSGSFPVLRLQDLEAWRDDRCLFRQLSCVAAPGEVLRVAGPNGAGKTTLLQMIAGLSALPGGRVGWRDVWCDEDPLPMRRDQLFLGHLPGIKGLLTVSENLRALAACAGHPLPEPQMAAALERVGLAGYEDTPAAWLSAGQKRRVALARLFTEPAGLWLLDEPFTAIDRQGVRDLEGWIADQAGAGGVVVLTTHHDLVLRCPVRELTLTAPADEDAA